MKDAVGREISYLRVSITDRCNLRCRYCMPGDIPHTPREQILRYEEILRVCRAATALEIRSFKVTGGEPLVRRGAVGFLRQLRALPGVESVTITTNGVLLEPLVPELAAMGLSGVNISLDTLNRETYRRLTGQDALPNVLSALEAAVDAGLRVKINCVPITGVNSGELADIAALGERLPVDVRFIELMPSKAGRSFCGVPGATVRKELLQRYPDLIPAPNPGGAGPARYYSSNRMLGLMGFIDPMTGCFCGDCNRVRLTSEGLLKPCLYHDTGVPLRDLLRDGVEDRELLRMMQAAIAQKPERHHFAGGAGNGIGDMSRIGG